VDGRHRETEDRPERAAADLKTWVMSAASFTQWFQRAGAPDPKTWTPTRTLYASWRAWAERTGEHSGSVALLAKRMRAAGVEHHRTNSVKGWCFRLVDVAAIKQNIRTAALARRNAHEAGDASAKVAAIRAELAAKRAAGAMLDADPLSPLALNLAKATREHCIQLARLTDAEFAAKVESVARRAVAALRAAPRPGAMAPAIRMAITPWFVDDDGALTRTLMAVDDETAGANGRPQLET
jgi:hypothetical protein